LFAPAGTPAPIIQKIYEAAKQINNDAKGLAALKNNGEVVMMDPAAFAQRIKAEVPKWGEVIDREGLVLE
jgi:tripartite-type tricarboxylate transporter receptor subunit TctC